MLDISNEDLITLDEAAQLIPVGRCRRLLNLSTIFRWITEGVGGIRLDAIRIGARWLTTEAALQQFARQLTEAALREEPTTLGEQAEADGQRPEEPKC